MANAGESGAKDEAWTRKEKAKSMLSEAVGRVKVTKNCTLLKAHIELLTP